MAPFDEANYSALRSDAAAFVRSRGPLPALRIRRQPYGLLPVSSLDAWVPSAGDAVEAIKLRVLRHSGRSGWRRPAMLPRAGSGKDQDEELAGVLSQDSVSDAPRCGARRSASTPAATSDPGGAVDNRPGHSG